MSLIRLSTILRPEEEWKYHHNVNMSKESVIDYCVDIAEAIKVIHSLGRAYNMLNPLNVLFDAESGEFYGLINYKHPSLAGDDYISAHGLIEDDDAEFIFNQEFWFPLWAFENFPPACTNISLERFRARLWNKPAPNYFTLPEEIVPLDYYHIGTTLYMLLEYCARINNNGWHRRLNRGITTKELAAGINPRMWSGQPKAFRKVNEFIQMVCFTSAIDSDDEVLGRLKEIQSLVKNSHDYIKPVRITREQHTPYTERDIIMNSGYHIRDAIQEYYKYTGSDIY